MDAELVDDANLLAGQHGRASAKVLLDVKWRGNEPSQGVKVRVTEVFTPGEVPIILGAIREVQDRRRRMLYRNTLLSQRLEWVEDREAIQRTLEDVAEFIYDGPELISETGSVYGQAFKDFALFFYGDADPKKVESMGYVASLLGDPKLGVASNGPGNYYRGLDKFIEFSLGVFYGTINLREIRGIGSKRQEFLTALCRAVLLEALEAADDAQSRSAAGPHQDLQ